MRAFRAFGAACSGRPVILCVVLMCLGLSLPAGAAMIDPSLRFETVETEHFQIHYHQGLGDIAKRTAVLAENAHRNLAPLLKWQPAEKTQVVLLDITDLANGMATVLPYNAIYIFVVPPLPEMTIGDYEDWLEMVIVHEYAHILTMDPARGYSSVMRRIFGKTLPGLDPLSLLMFIFTAPPNVFMPGWWHEGMATWAETELTGKGRGRSSYYEMIYRMDVAEDHIPRIDEFNGDVPDWPGHSLRYIYGSLLERHIARHYGADVPGSISIKQSGRVPYFINASPRKFTGKDYRYLYREMVWELKQEQTARIERLKSRPLTEMRPLPVEGERVTNPRLSPDGRFIALNRRDPHFHQEIVILDTETMKEAASIRRLPSDHSMAWSPGGRKLYFTQADLRGSFNLYQDIYSYDMHSGSVERVTHNLRTKDIDISHDGGKAVFVKVEAGRQNIAVVPLDSPGEVKVLTDFDGYALSGPRWSPDDDFIVFSRRDNEGHTSIEVLDTRDGRVRTLLSDGRNNIYPTWSPDGRYIIFTSDRTGVYNLFALSLSSGKMFQVTHVLGGAFQADVSRERIVFSYYHSRGYSVMEIPYDESAWSEEFSPSISPFWDSVEKDREDLSGGEGPGEDDTAPQPQDDAGAAPERTDETTVVDRGSYSPLHTLVPRFWLPTLMFDDEGAVFGAFTAGQDVLGYHTFILNAGLGVSGQVYGDLTYVYNRWYPSFFLRASSLPVFYSEFFGDDDFYERRTSLAGGVILPLNFVESRYSLMAGYEYRKVDALSAVSSRTVDGLEVFEGRRDNVFAAFLYRGALKYPYSVSREEGRNITLLYRNYSGNMGSDLEQREYSGVYDEYVRVWRHHVACVNLRGAVSDGDLIAQQAFQLGGLPLPGNDYPLRGFPQGFETGRYIVTGSLEYRFPVYYILHGWSTKPFFFDRLHVAVFTDAGNVWGYRKGFHWDDFSVGIGTEVRLDMVLGYHLRITPAVGVARGLTDNGETQVYFTIYTEL